MGYRALYLAIPGIVLALLGLLLLGSWATGIGAMLVVLAVVAWPLLTADERSD
jgi:ABC-type dipeptide/oligopeptide/nickel transport system permease subunit